jgi:hypothetical protein
MTLTPAITLTNALCDPALFGDVFAAPSFWTWRVVAKVIDAIPLIEQREIDLFEQCTGRRYNRDERRRIRRLTMLAGRRAGKDRFFSAVAVWRAALCSDWRKHISPGEQAVVILLGGDRKQANILSRYCTGLIAKPILSREVVRQTNEVIEFKNGASLEIATNDARLVRGRSAIAVLGSEVCHWQTAEHSASSDEEVVGAAEPSLSMCPDGGLMALWSSVHRKRGYAYRKFKQLFGNDAAEADDLVWVAPSAAMNPRLPQLVVDRALNEDPAKARAEFLSQWREDLSDWCPLDAIEACTDRGVFERPARPGINYVAWADAAGGTGQDSFALAIAHRGAPYQLDLIREVKPRFIPAQVVADFAKILKAYKITKVHGDKYAGGFHANEWACHGIKFMPAEREHSTSENYLRLLPMVLAGRVSLIDHTTLRNQLSSLERRVGTGERETVIHPQHANAHDDVATAAAGAIVTAASGSGYSHRAWLDDDPDGSRAWRAFSLAQHIARFG